LEGKSTTTPFVEWSRPWIPAGFRHRNGMRGLNGFEWILPKKNFNINHYISLLWMVVLSPISNPLLVPAQHPPDPNPPGPIRGPFRVCGQLRQLDPSGCAAQILRRQQFQTLKIKATSSNLCKLLFFREDDQPWDFFGPQSDREHRCFDLRKVMLFGTSYCILLAEHGHEWSVTSCPRRSTWGFLRCCDGVDAFWFEVGHSNPHWNNYPVLFPAFSWLASPL
jgi:hypothetical protein